MGIQNDTLYSREGFCFKIKKQLNMHLVYIKKCYFLGFYDKEMNTLGSYKTQCVTIYNGFIHNYSKLEINQMSSDWWATKQNVI